MKIPSEVPSFLALKELTDSFVREREWDRFHLPKNIALALAGECGEVAEIFQWRGSLDHGLTADFSQSDIDHISEEIADVCIYSTRLCSVCNIDLAKTVKYLVRGFDEACFPVTNIWDGYTFQELSTDILKSPLRSLHFSTSSPRDIALAIQVRMGSISELFLAMKEAECVPGLYGWPREEVHKLATSVAFICVLLSCLCRLIGRSLDRCLADKLTKNAKKYPVDLVKGSSAKYTTYASKTKAAVSSTSRGAVTLIGVASMMVGVFLGVKYSLRHMKDIL